ncbi:hypothetical protein JCM8097_005998 [Rhodosporidiobolus ruineniae]
MDAKQPRLDSVAPIADAPTESGPVDSAEVGAEDKATTAPAAPPTGGEEVKSKDAEEVGEADKSKEAEEKQDEEEDEDWGIKVEDLKPIRVAYEEKALAGFEDPQDVVYPYSQALNDKVFIWRGDITTLQVDCIVNAANKSLLGGGGVDGAIHRAAGRGLYTECKTLNGAKTGETKLTGGHDLPAKHVAHTVGPIYGNASNKVSEEKLRECYRGTLELCVKNGLRTVAFSGISTGVYGYPLDDAAQVACDEVRKFLEGPDGDKIDAVIYTVFRQIDVNSYLDNLPAYFPPPPSSDQPASATDEKDKPSVEQQEAVDGAQDKPPKAKEGDEKEKKE